MLNGKITVVEWEHVIGSSGIKRTIVENNNNKYMLVETTNNTVLVIAISDGSVADYFKM